MMNDYENNKAETDLVLFIEDINNSFIRKIHIEKILIAKHS